MGGKSHREVEIKLRVSSAAAGRRLLRQAGFRVARRRVLESNVVYDTPDGALRYSRSLLRVRTAGARVLLTFKGPPDGDSRHKSREEIELRLSDGPAFGKVLERLGMKPSFRYEKYRTEFTRADSSGLATLDETPIGDYIELEGTPNWIDRMASALGFGEADYITDSYARLFFEGRGAEPSAAAHMLFGDDDR